MNKTTVSPLKQTTNQVSDKLQQVSPNQNELGSHEKAMGYSSPPCKKASLVGEENQGCFGSPNGR